MLMKNRKREDSGSSPSTEQRSPTARVSPTRPRTPRPAPPKKPNATAEQAFGERIKDARIAKGWSQAGLAKRMSSRYHGWTQSTVAKTEAATRPVRLDEAAALADVLALPLLGLVTAEKGSERLQAEAELQRLLLERAALRAREHDAIRRREDAENEIEHIIGVYEDLQEAISDATRQLERVIGQ